MEVVRYPTSVLTPNSFAMREPALLGADDAKVLRGRIINETLADENIKALTR